MKFLRRRGFEHTDILDATMYRYFVDHRSIATRRLYEFTIHSWIQFSFSIVSISYTSGNLSRNCYILYKGKISKKYIRLKI